MVPLGLTVNDVQVAGGAHLLAALAAHALVGIDTEFPVGDHAPVELSTDDMREEPGRETLSKPMDTLLAAGDYGDELVEVVLSLLQLAPFALRCVGVHEGQADIALRHD